MYINKNTQITWQTELETQKQTQAHEYINRHSYKHTTWHCHTKMYRSDLIGKDPHIAPQFLTTIRCKGINIIKWTDSTTRGMYSIVVLVCLKH